MLQSKFEQKEIEQQNLSTTKEKSKRRGTSEKEPRNTIVATKNNGKNVSKYHSVFVRLKLLSVIGFDNLTKLE